MRYRPRSTALWRCPAAGEPGLYAALSTCTRAPGRATPLKTRPKPKKTLGGRRPSEQGVTEGGCGHTAGAVAVWASAMRGARKQAGGPPRAPPRRRLPRRDGPAPPQAPTRRVAAGPCAAAREHLSSRTRPGQAMPDTQPSRTRPPLHARPSTHACVAPWLPGIQPPSTQRAPRAHKAGRVCWSQVRTRAPAHLGTDTILLMYTTSGAASSAALLATQPCVTPAPQHASAAARMQVGRQQQGRRALCPHPRAPLPPGQGAPRSGTARPARPAACPAAACRPARPPAAAARARVRRRAARAGAPRPCPAPPRSAAARRASRPARADHRAPPAVGLQQVSRLEDPRPLVGLPCSSAVSLPLHRPACSWPGTSPMGTAQKDPPHPTRSACRGSPSSARGATSPARPRERTMDPRMPATSSPGSHTL
jgi:hypothetical protein